MTGVLYTLLSPLMVMAYLLLLYVPGYLGLAILGARGAITRAVAPALSLLIYTALGILLNLLNIPWKLHNVTISLIIFVVLEFIITRIFSLNSVLSELTVPNRLIRDYWFLAASLLVIILLFLTFTITGMAGSVPQHSDSIFHLNGVYTIVRSGNGSIVNALSPLYSLHSVPVMYPSIWHSFVALLATSTTVIPATNAMLMALPLIWLHNISVFTNVVFSDDHKVMRYVPFIVFFTPISVTVITHVIDRWPNGMGIAILPGLLAVSTHIVRLWFPNWVFKPRDNLVYPILLILLWVGAGLAHPTVIVSLVIMLFPVLAYLAILALRATRYRRTTRRGIIHLRVMLIVIGLLFLMGASAIIGRLSQGTPDSISWSSAWTKIASVISLYTYWSASVWGDIPIGFVGLFIVSGAVLVLVGQRARWLVGCYMFFFLICLGALVFIPIATSLTSLWFSDSLRMLATLSVLAIPLAAQGLKFYTELFQRISRNVLLMLQTPRKRQLFKSYARVFGCSIVIFALAGATVLRTTVVYRLYHPPVEWHMTQFSNGEYELQQRLGKTLTGRGLVLGEAANGSGLLPVTAGVPVALKQQNYSSLDSQGWYLRHYFRDLRTDASVCRILRRNNINYFYEDDTREFSEHYLPARSPGLFNVDTSMGFTLVDQSDEVKVWKINVCDKKPLPLPFIKLHP